MPLHVSRQLVRASEADDEHVATDPADRVAVAREDAARGDRADSAGAVSAAPVRQGLGVCERAAGVGAAPAEQWVVDSG